MELENKKHKNKIYEYEIRACVWRKGFVYTTKA